MSDKPQITEEQGYEMAECYHAQKPLQDRFVDILKSNGYIKKSEIEVIREQYNETLDTISDKVAKEEMFYVNRYVILLEKEIERLNNKLDK